MADKKQRIMDLMRKGIITQDEALELLEGSGASANENPSSENEKIDSNGFENHKIDTSEAIKNTFNTMTDSITEVFKGLSKKVDENVDFSNGWPKVKTIEKIDEHDITEDFHSIYINVKAGKIDIRPDDQAHVKLEYTIYGAVNDLDSYLAENAKLSIDEEEFKISITGRISAKISLYLPEKMYEKIALKLLNGNIKIEEIKVSDLFLSSKNGQFDLTDTKADKLSLELLNGEIRFDGSFVDGDISLANGDIRLSQRDLRATNLSAKNINGDIKLSIPENLALTGHLKTIFGGYKTKLRLEQPFETGKNGATIVRTGDEGLTFDIEARSGTIWLKDGE